MSGTEDPEEGFTLVETLVAFVIISGAIILALSTMTQALQRMRRSSEIVQASELARSFLASLSTRGIGFQKISSGNTENLQWKLVFVPLAPNAGEPVQPTRIRITISDRRGVEIPQARLETILILQAPP